MSFEFASNSMKPIFDEPGLSNHHLKIARVRQLSQMQKAFERNLKLKAKQPEENVKNEENSEERMDSKRFCWIVDVKKQYGEFFASELEVRLGEDYIEVSGKQNWRPALYMTLVEGGGQSRLSFEVRKPLKHPLDETSVIAFMKKEGTVYVCAQKIDLQVPETLKQLFENELQKQAKQRRDQPLQYPVVVFRPTELGNRSEASILKSIFDHPEKDSRCIHMKQPMPPTTIESKRKNEEKSQQDVLSGQNTSSASLQPLIAETLKPWKVLSKQQSETDENNNIAGAGDMNALLHSLSRGCQKTLHEPLTIEKPSPMNSIGHTVNMESLLQHLNYGNHSIQNRH